MSLDPVLKMFDNKSRMEKYLLRKAFDCCDKDGKAFLPSSILWRRKNGFSDSVSSQTRSWSTVIQEFVDKRITDKEFARCAKLFSPKPITKEAYYYRKIYVHYYPGEHRYLTPYQWLPKWCGDVKDPSARVLSIYKAD